MRQAFDTADSTYDRFTDSYRVYLLPGTYYAFVDTDTGTGGRDSWHSAQSTCAQATAITVGAGAKVTWKTSTKKVCTVKKERGHRQEEGQVQTLSQGTREAWLHRVQQAVHDQGQVDERHRVDARTWKVR